MATADCNCRSRLERGKRLGSGSTTSPGLSGESHLALFHTVLLRSIAAPWQHADGVEQQTELGEG